MYMKSKITILLICVFVTFANVKAQVWTFDTDGDTEGWNPGNTASGDVANGALTWTWGAHNAPKWTKSGLSLSTDDYKKILVRLKNPNSVEVNTATNSARVVTTTNGTSGTKFFSFSHSSSDTEFHTYIINVSADPTKFNGTCTSVQIQGMRNQEVPGGTLSLSEFRLIRDDNTWTGAVSNEWEVAGNWSNNIVPTGEIVTIPAVANQPVVSVANAVVADLTLEEGAVVTVSNGQTLTVLRDVIASGAGTGYVIVGSGSSLVTYGSVAGVNHVFARTTTFDSSTGKYSVVGSPVAGASTSSLGNLVYSYDETIAYTSNRFVEVTSPETMVAGNAYFSAFTGNISFTGTPTTGRVNVPLVYNAGDADNAGFNLVSNPYSSAIAFDMLVNSTFNTDIDGTIYLWDDGGSNAGQRTNADYITVNEIGQVSGGSGRSADWNGHIGSGQGFFVKATTAGNLNFDNEMKVAGNNADANYFRKDVNSPANAIQSLRVSLANTKGIANQTLIGFLSDATVGFDRLYDAYKMDGANGVKLYTLLDQKPMAIQGLPIADESIIPLGISLNEAGNYTLNLDFIKNWPEDLNVYLEDTQLNKVVDLGSSSSYSFSSTASTDELRFNLIISGAYNVLANDKLKSSNLEVHFTQNSVILKNHKQTVGEARVSVLDISGAILMDRAVSDLKHEAILDFQFDTNKVYLLKVYTATESYESKIVFN